MNIPADMNLPDLAEACHAKAAVSFRDMLILLGASDQALRDCDEMGEILEREPWRRDGVRFVEIGRTPGGMQFGIMEGEVDWSGTRFVKAPS